MIRAFAAFVFIYLSAVSATAQDSFWVQIEAHQTLTDAQDRARGYAGQLDDVHGYYLGDGFYGIFIGPFDKPQAETALARLLSRRQIPSDSFVKNGSRFKQQYWPIGGGANTTQSVTLPADPAAQDPAVSTAELPRDPAPTPDETVQEARASERDLERPAREELQIAMQWSGFYNAAIDGSFGRGTRAAMQDWQIANNQEPTGVLTTQQRALLLQQYNAVLDSVNMRLVRDDASGIQMQIPTGVVAFSEYQPPFVKFEASGEIAQAKVLFISQAGNPGKLAGLFEVLQILDIVPPTGDRALRGDSFFIEGIDDSVHSYTSVTLQDGEIKGFSLVWPQGDDQRRERILDVMLSSFESLDGTLDPRIVPASEDQSIDMVAGLAVRQPRLSRSGFYASTDGLVVTTPEAVESCERITLDRTSDAEVIATDLELGIVILRPLEPLSPINIAAFQPATPRLQDRIAVAGYPFSGVLGAPTLTFGEVVDIRSLTGDDRMKRIAMLPQPGDVGGPIFDESGAVLGMLLPRQDGTTQVLPQEVNFSLDAAQIVALLIAQGVEPVMAATSAPISPVALTRRAADIAVLVSCW